MAKADSSKIEMEVQSLSFDLLEHGEMAFKPTLMLVCEQLGLLGDLIAADKLELFIARIISLMPSNEYHNLLHITDVVQTTYVEVLSLQQHCGQAGCLGLSRLEQLALVIAAAGHDLSHPGVSNHHQLATQRTPEQQGQQNTVYEAINEKMHADRCCKVLEETCLLDELSADDKARVTSLVQEMILHTDMNQHFGLLKQFTERKVSRGGVIAMTSAEDHQLICNFLLHMADVSNPARPWEVASYMGRAITSEMIAQYMTEQDLKQRGQVVANDKFLIADTAKPSFEAMPKSQRFFITTFVKPLLDMLVDVTPAFHKEAIVSLESNLEHWDSLLNNTIAQAPHPEAKD